MSYTLKLYIPWVSSFYYRTCFSKRIGGSREDSRLLLCLSVSSAIKTPDGLERSNNAIVGGCKHLGRNMAETISK